MQLQNVRFAGERLIEAYGDGGFRMTDGRFKGTIRILPECIDSVECTDIEQVNEALLKPFIECKDDIELVLLGTGAKQRFPDHSLRQWFMQEELALEVMDTGAACRTYNVLVTEDRRVAALIMAV